MEMVEEKKKEGMKENGKENTFPLECLVCKEGREKKKKKKKIPHVDHVRLSFLTNCISF
jgi:C4-type Zn-finger protein